MFISEGRDRQGEENSTTYIATLSGGKDSAAMLDLLLRDKKPLDHIVFYDTLHEFAAMYEYTSPSSASILRRDTAKRSQF